MKEIYNEKHPICPYYDKEKNVCARPGCYLITPCSIKKNGDGKRGKRSKGN